MCNRYIKGNVSVEFFRKKVVDDERHTDRGRVRCNSDAFISKTFGRRISIVIKTNPNDNDNDTDSDNKRSVRRRRRRLKVETSGGGARVERAHALRQRSAWAGESRRFRSCSSSTPIAAASSLPARRANVPAAPRDSTRTQATLRCRLCLYIY
jgi:hypothetical protein